MSPTQYVYRAGHSTEGASVDVVGAISDKRDMGQVTCATSCDLSKAFYCVSRDGATYETRVVRHIDALVQELLWG